MGFVNVAAHPVILLSIGANNADFITVCNAELFLVVGRNEADTFLCMCQMTIKPLFDKAATIQVVVALGGVHPQKIGVVVRIYTDTVLRGIAALECQSIITAICSHVRAAFQQATVIGVIPQRIDNFIELHLKGIAFQFLAVIEPCGVEVLSVAVKVCPEVANAAGLHRELLTLGITIADLLGS